MHRGERLEYLKSSRSYSDIRENEEYEDEQDEKLPFSEAARDSIQQRRDQKNKLQELVRQKNKAKSSYREEEPDEYEDEYEEYEDEGVQKDRSNSKQLTQNARNGGSRSGQASKPATKVFDSFGQFFGPSQRVVAPRILEEEKARQEAQRIAARAALQQKDRLKDEKSCASQGSGDRRKPASGKDVAVPSSKRMDERKVKVGQLKAARDYSFLFEPEDGAAPPAGENSRVPSGAAQHPSGDQQRSNDRQRSNGGPRPEGKFSQSRRDQPLSRPPVRPNSLPHSGNGSRPGNHSQMPRDRPSQTANTSKQRDVKGGASVMAKGNGKALGGHGDPRTASARKGNSDSLRDLVAGRTIVREKQVPKPVDRPLARPPVPNGKPRMVPPQGLSRQPKMPEERSRVSQSGRLPPPPPPRQVDPGRAPPRVVEGQRRPPVPQKGGGGERPPLRSLEGRPQAKRPEFSKQKASGPPLKKMAIPRRREEEEEEEDDDDQYSQDSFLDDDEDVRGGGRSALSSVLGMFRRNYQENHRGRHYEDEDSDDGAMEVGWDEVRREEILSARVAREEDDRELALEEERERRRLERKKRKSR